MPQTKTIEEIFPKDDFYSDFGECDDLTCNLCQTCMQKNTIKALADLLLGLPSLQPIDGNHLIANSINEYVRATRQEIAEALGVKDV